MHAPADHQKLNIKLKFKIQKSNSKVFSYNLCCIHRFLKWICPEVKLLLSFSKMLINYIGLFFQLCSMILNIISYPGFFKSSTLSHYIIILTSYHCIMKNYILPRLFLILDFVTLHNYFHFVSSYHEKLYLTQAFCNSRLCQTEKRYHYVEMW